MHQGSSTERPFWTPSPCPGNGGSPDQIHRRTFPSSLRNLQWSDCRLKSSSHMGSCAAGRCHDPTNWQWYSSPSSADGGGPYQHVRCASRGRICGQDWRQKNQMFGIRLCLCNNRPAPSCRVRKRQHTDFPARAIQRNRFRGQSVV